MAVIQNLYQVFKIPASRIVASNCDIGSYTITQGLKEGNIVSIGDNIVFQQIRYMHGDRRDHRELFSYVQRLRNAMHDYRRKGMHKEAQILDRRITDVLFVSDIVNVVVDGKKSDFNKFRVSGFDLNGTHYTYLCSGSGQVRRNTATFVNASLEPHLRKVINCGLDEKTSEFVLAKYSAYFALAFSSVLWVRTPRVCVIRDFHRTIPAQCVDFITQGTDGESTLERRTMDIDLNCADGQGLIDPSFARLWASDMDLGFVPCSFVARSCFVKGNLATFDFRAYAHEHGISTITDRWGTTYPIDEVDVLLSESQFKTCKYYSSWEEYLGYMERGEIHWGVARYNRQSDPLLTLANYQYIQALDLSDSDLSELISPTLSWIRSVCSGEVLPTLLYCLGASDPGTGYGTLYGKAQTTALRAVAKNAAFLSDSYVRRKVYRSIADTIDHAKLGKVWVRGSYQFMVSDPVAQCQSALGLEPTGVVPANHVWCDTWRRRFLDPSTPPQSLPHPPRGECGPGPYVDVCRSPMIDRHEHTPSTVMLDSPEADRWLSHMYSGCILSTYDTATARLEDADFDGDIVLVTDNPQFICGSHKDHPIITYEKGLARPAPMDIPHITATVMKGFGTGVGGFSNAATCMYAMAASFDRPGMESARDTLLTRIKLLREIVGQEIDRIKGADKPFLPRSWKGYVAPAPDETPEQRRARILRNSMAITRKPYFFRYLYPELNRRHKQFEASYSQVCKDLYGMSLRKLLSTPPSRRPAGSERLVRRYRRDCPLIQSDCTMNRLCRAFESADLDIRYARNADGTRSPDVSLLPTYEERFASNPPDPSRLATVRSMYRDYCSRRQVRYLEETLSSPSLSAHSPDPIQRRRARSAAISMLMDSLRDRLADSGIPAEEFLYHCHCLSLSYARFNWGFAWDVLGEQLLPLIPQGRSFVPVRDPSGTFEYLGDRYSLSEVTQEGEIAMDRLIAATSIGDDSSLPDLPPIPGLPPDGDGEPPDPDASTPGAMGENRD